MTQQASALAVPVRGKRPRPWYVQLWFQVLVAMVVGIALGHLYPNIGAQMQPLGDAFIKAIRVLIAPIIFCTVVHGISSMANMAKVGRVALKALIPALRRTYTKRLPNSCSISSRTHSLVRLQKATCSRCCTSRYSVALR